MYANISDTLFDQKSPVHWEAGFPRWHKWTTHGQCKLETESAKWANSLKKGISQLCKFRKILSWTRSIHSSSVNFTTFVFYFSSSLTVISALQRKMEALKPVNVG